MRIYEKIRLCFIVFYLGRVLRVDHLDLLNFESANIFLYAIRVRFVEQKQHCSFFPTLMTKCFLSFTFFTYF